jgi:hypothetical protein
MLQTCLFLVLQTDLYHVNHEHHTCLSFAAKFFKDRPLR